MVLRRVFPFSLCAFLSFLLAGCGSGPIPSGSIGSSRLGGSVHGGQQPVIGASIQLYTVGTTADGSAATPLLTQTVTSDSTGSFTITGLYSCTGATQVYIVATGGNPGLSTANPDIALMAALGPCSSLTPGTFININELTTVAAVTALAPFMTSATAIGSSSYDNNLLANQFTLANQYVDTTTGLSPGNSIPPGDTVPTAELNTLADILSACINSTGGTAGDGSLCGNLFSLTTLSPSPAPTNTIAAMLNLAYNPTLSTSALYALAPPTPPFQPTLTSAPASFLVSLQSLSPIQASPSAVNFQDVTVGSFSTIQTITLQNFSGLGNIATVGANSTDFGVGDSSPTYIGYCTTGAYQSCWVQVQAHPSAAGVRNASIAIDYNYGLSTLYIPLSVTGIASNPSSLLSTSFVNFPPTISGTSSTPVAVALSNSGPGTITVSGVAINGAANNNFTQTNNCTSVAVNASCTLYVTFTPATTGVQSASLQVTSSATGSNTVSLSGIGLALGTAPSLWPSSLTYNIWGANEDLIVINSGTIPLNITGVEAGTTGGEESQHTYSISNNNCAASVPAGSTCTFAVQNLLPLPLSSYTQYPGGFPSGVTGQAYVNDGFLTTNILTNSGAILLQNNVVSGTVSFSSSQIGIAQTSSIELASIGSQLVNGSPVTTIGGSPAASLAIGGANPGDFSVSAVQPTVSSTPSSSCPAVTTGTQPCTITVTFTPTAVGTRTAEISLDANGSSTGQYIYVTGRGPGPFFSASPAAVTMQSHIPTTPDTGSAGLANVQLINNGTTTLNLAASFAGANASDMSVVSNNCSAVAPNAYCFIDISFTESTVGNYSASLVVSDANSTFSLSIPITASTSYWPIAASPTILNFSSQPVGSTSTKQSFRLGDTNLAPLGHPITVSLQPSSNFTLPDGSSCPASTTQLCQLTVAFAPQAAGSVSETLTATDQTTGLQATIALTGTGVSPDYTLSTASVAFPLQTIGTSSQMTINLTNASTHAITVSGVSVVGASNGNFTATTGCSSVGVGATCPITITFAPLAAGPQSASVTISSDASNSVTNISVTGSAQ